MNVYYSTGRSDISATKGIGTIAIEYRKKTLILILVVVVFTAGSIVE